MKKRFTDEQIIRILREAESRDEPVKDQCKRHNISDGCPLRLPRGPSFRWKDNICRTTLPDRSTNTRSANLAQQR
jgi:hypothetical protein